MNTKILVPVTMCSMAVGADKILDEVRKLTKEFDLGDTVVVATGCINGLCSIEPVMKICMQGMPDTVYGNLTEQKVKTILLMHVMGRHIVKKWAVEY